MSDKCKETVYPPGQWGTFCPAQCQRNAVKDGYCTQHHPDSVRKRTEESNRRYEERRKNEPLYKLHEAQKRIAELEAQLAVMKGTQ